MEESYHRWQAAVMVRQKFELLQMRRVEMEQREVIRLRQQAAFDRRVAKENC